MGDEEMNFIDGRIKVLPLRALNYTEIFQCFSVSSVAIKIICNNYSAQSLLLLSQERDNEWIFLL
jgi:hypothetical protein